ncbi:hypothetical protein CLV78_11276 [Aliiruegeria haliotis]|uniref:Membrane protein DUF2157 n=1 Tax=Aliiruegeria haliotis TaxID=1280846 RepID=A0A2T0RHQ0_9RHOB|nr:hypothetical protein [Aliiruegeria haliotis]PRY20703.1 hypothetical protein CLV78_11276 [Aliiruegeria haliotis]
MNLDRDDIRAAVRSGMISEAQAASILALAEQRHGVRENMDGLDEPFELFRGFNEIFIVVGLGVLFTGWMVVSGLSTLAELGNSGSTGGIYALITLAVSAWLSTYFTLKRRMVAPSIALVMMFGVGALQLGMTLGWQLGLAFHVRVAFASGLTTALFILHYFWFRVPFTMALIGLGVFVTTGSMLVLGGAGWPTAADFFHLTNEGPYAVLTIALGVIGTAVALWFDMGDPHRITRRSQAGFWLHVISAPAIVNTVALTLLEVDTPAAQAALIAFLCLMALFAIVIDRRSFLVAGVGYVVALAVIILERQAGLAVLGLGLGLVLLGAQWERLRGGIMSGLPSFPGKDRLPPWGQLR